ncbi:uncharacterized protein YALI1_F00867g [Yarrowia lipolytica]|uniref:Uncharacterized protein n=1 Tax=Yarrowia lipolytica TaxID=4952 RepID=A0A1D8NLG3_YARLL|nr:hypothetical protein YALI1_F00867g [Yarrowia lipolytica]
MYSQFEGNCGGDAMHSPHCPRTQFEFRGKCPGWGIWVRGNTRIGISRLGFTTGPRRRARAPATSAGHGSRHCSRSRWDVKNVPIEFRPANRVMY